MEEVFIFRASGIRGKGVVEVVISLTEGIAIHEHVLPCTRSVVVRLHPIHMTQGIGQSDVTKIERIAKQVHPECHPKRFIPQKVWNYGRQTDGED